VRAPLTPRERADLEGKVQKAEAAVAVQEAKLQKLGPRSNLNSRAYGVNAHSLATAMVWLRRRREALERR
jgi:hypothetical protein